MEIWYKPQFVLRSKKESVTPSLYNPYRNGKYQLDTNLIFLPNKNQEYNICEIFSQSLKTIGYFPTSVSFNDINITFKVNNKYIAFYPEDFSNKVFENWHNTNDILTYNESVIKQLLE